MEIIEIISHYSKLLNEVIVTPGIFYAFTTVMITINIIRFILIIKMEWGKKHKLDKSIIYKDLLNCFTEFLISYVACYLMIKLTFANPESYIMNYAIAPAVGMVLAIYLNNKYITPLFKSSSNKKKEEDKNINPSITVNINNEKKEKSEDSDDINDEKYKHIDNNVAEDDNFNYIIIDSINSIKDIIKNTQAKYSNRLKVNTEKIDKTVKSVEDIDGKVETVNAKIEITNSTLEVLKQSAMNDKKLELKSLIYDCLNKGFATPEENDKITIKYNSYVALGGNHEVKALYENHYLNLQVHEDRRQMEDLEYALHKRARKVINCEYGKYDSEF